MTGKGIHDEAKARCARAAHGNGAHKTYNVKLLNGPNSEAVKVNGRIGTAAKHLFIGDNNVTGCNDGFCGAGYGVYTYGACKACCTAACGSGHIRLNGRLHARDKVCRTCINAAVGNIYGHITREIIHRNGPCTGHAARAGSRNADGYYAASFQRICVCAGRVFGIIFHALLVRICLILSCVILRLFHVCIGTAKHCGKVVLFVIGNNGC